MPETSRGPLAHLRIVEFVGMGPGPFACMLLADLGADIVSIDRINAPPASPIVGRGRTRVALDLKKPHEVERALDLVHHADMLVEGFRPGVMERNGLGPDACLARNPRLVYGRMTGWGQNGPLAHTAGHDIDYIAVTGALNAIGTRDKPIPPLNLLGDYGGGALYLVLGLLAAYVEAQRSGQGQVVDAAICDGTVSLLASLLTWTMQGTDTGRRADNMTDGGAPYYDVYATRDSRHVAIGAIEPRFFAELSARIGLPVELRDAQHDRSRWPELRAGLAAIFVSRTQAEWTSLLAESDGCYAPILSLADASDHAHMKARGTFVERDGIIQPAPAPRFSRTPGAIRPTVPDPVAIDEQIAAWAEGGHA